MEAIDVGKIIPTIASIVIMVPAGIGFILAGLYFIKKRQRIKRNGEVIELPVIRMIEDSSNVSSSDGNYHGPSYYPVFELPYNGKVYELKTETWSHKTKEGDRIRIRFNKENPYEYEIYGDKRMPFVSVMFFATGVVMIVIAIFLAIFFSFFLWLLF